MRRTALIVLFIGCWGGGYGLKAQDVQFGVSGYAKNLAIRSQAFLSEETYFLDISRFRLKGEADAGAAVHAELWLDTELLLGSFLRSSDYAFSRTLEDPRLLDLDWTVGSGDEYHLRQALFRAFATFYPGQTQVTVGRQRVAWGTGFVWNPTDLLNPIDPTALEREEKGGVDAVYLLAPVGELTRVEAVVAPGRRRKDGSMAVRGGFHAGEYDLSVMGGRFRKDWVLGGDFAGYAGDAGVRGEAAFTLRDGGRNHLRVVLNADYNFPGDYYVLLEGYYNGAGAWKTGDYDRLALLRGAVLNLGRLYGALSVGKSVTPLLYFNLYVLGNLNDRSGLAGPALSWSVAQNLELTISTYAFFGGSETEYGALHNVYFGGFQLYF